MNCIIRQPLNYRMRLKKTLNNLKKLPTKKSVEEACSGMCYKLHKFVELYFRVFVKILSFKKEVFKYNMLVLVVFRLK